tara:strand:+ start:86 stop:448 length:363 start_codon:yes stop_codon:yes gene_type:complete
MNEWKISVPIALQEELENCFLMGPIIDDNGMRSINEEQFARINGLKIDIFSNEHPPPHFRVCFQGTCNNFTINDCTPLNGVALSKYFRNIKKWHKNYKVQLIEFWNSKRPSDCPVGTYKE